MECTKCDRLKNERESLQRIHELAISNLSAVGESTEKELTEKLKSVAEAAKVDLDRVEAEIAQHQSAHAVPKEQ